MIGRKKMQGQYKKFDSRLYEENNWGALDTVLRVLAEDDLFACLNEDKYGPDIVVFRGFKPVRYVEVEVKRVWKGDQFPWDTIQLPERKGKFLELGKPIEFWILNEGMDHAVIIPESAVQNSPLEEVSNKYIEDGELFYKIAIDDCIIRKLL